jgi:hypothetical protein
MALMFIYWLQICCKINQSTTTLHGVRNHPALLYLHQKPFQTNVADINEVICVEVGGIEVTGRQRRRCRKLLDDLKERRGYYHLKEEALDRTMWRARFGRGFGPVVRQTTK